MTTDSDDEGRFREVNHHGINESERIGDDGDSRDSPGWAVQVQQHRQQPQGSVVRWERFLHVRSIKVLLVENDDSTRHVVTALLRNSNYEVVQAANGLQAWKILEDQTNHIDLVLTEVVMPGLSGIGLLCKIMSHNLRKNIPVITMSSHDSMALVFKCLSKGAVDFLVKPIRKNELKNLWQHIWRRCHSSSGSGSESGAQTQKSVKSKSSIKSENGSSSNEAYDNRSASLKVGDGSEDGSGTQTSWTKQAVEVQSSPAVCSRDQTAESPDNTCALVIHPNAEVSGNKWVPMTATRQSQEQEVQLGTHGHIRMFSDPYHAAKGKEFVTGKRRKFELQSEGWVKLTGTEQNTLPELEFTANGKRLDKRPAHHSVEYSLNKYEGVIAKNPEHQMNSKTIKEPALEINSTHANDSKELPGIELSLKKLRGVEDAGKTVQSDHNVLRRSELSAFSRYNTISSATNVPNVITENSSQLDNTIEIVKKEYVRDIRSHSDRNILQPGSDGVSNNIDVGSITNKLSTDPVVFKSEVTSTSPAFIPMRNDFKCPPQEVILVKTDDMTSSTKVAPRGSRQKLPVQHIHHHHHVHHYHNMEREHLLTNHDDFSLKKLAADSPHCGSSNVLCASGSKHGSNNQNGSSTAANAGGTNVESDVGLAGKNGDGNASGSGSGNMIDLNKSAQRETALTKSCQKRKERCFQKKVRYQNRKRQAEEQSLVRGLYVRQTGHDSSNSAMDD